MAVGSETLTIVDDHSRKRVTIEADFPLNGERITRALERLAQTPRVAQASSPSTMRPGFTGKVLDAWAYDKGIKLHFIRPGKPVENTYIGRFNGKFRDECLFRTIDEARAIIEIGRIDYNRHRPHSCPRQPDLRGVLQAGPGQTP